MKARRVIKWTLLGSVAAILAVVVGVILLVRWDPADYRPRVLGEPARIEVRRDMARRLAAAFDPAVLTAAGAPGVNNLRTERFIETDPETGRRVRVTRTTYDMPLTADELNTWIAAMPDTSVERLTRAGVSGPAIAVGKDRLTCYARVDKYDSVVGVDLAFRFDDDESVTITVRSRSAGRMPVPDDAVQRYKQAAIDQAARDLGRVSKEAGRMVAEELSETVAAAVDSLGPKLGDALAGKPVTLDIARAAGSTVRIRGIKTVKNKLTLDMVAEQRTAVGEAPAAVAAAAETADPR